MPLQWIRTEAFMQKDTRHHKVSKKNCLMWVQVLQFGNRVKFQSFNSVQILTTALAYFQTLIQLHENSILFIINYFELNLFNKYYRLIQFWISLNVSLMNWSDLFLTFTDSRLKTREKKHACSLLLSICIFGFYVNNIFLNV